jgi:hypothetical protein
MMKMPHGCWFNSEATQNQTHHFILDLDAGNGKSAERLGQQGLATHKDIINIPAFKV